MSDYASAASKARRAHASVARAESALSREPDSQALQIKLAARARLAKRSGDILQNVALENHVELCNYRLVAEPGKKFALPYISRSLLEYQNTFSQVYDALKNGAKQRTRIGNEAWSESLLEFGYSYSGSLGVVLLAPSERDFFQGTYDQAIEALFQVIDIDSQDTVKDIAKSLGEAVVKRVHDWSKANVDGGFDVDVRWSRSDGKQLGQLVSVSDMSRIVEIISATSDEKTVDIDVSGTLVGIDVLAGNFHFAVPDGEEYRGGLEEEFSRSEAVSVPGRYIARMTKTTKVVYATNREEVRFRLKGLRPDG
jgi:hypothetical protein